MPRETPAQTRASEKHIILLRGSLGLFTLDYIPPPRNLIDFVSAFYLFESDDALIRDRERADIAQLRFLLRGTADVIFPDAARTSMNGATLFGPRMSASQIEGDGPGLMFGCGLLPAGWIAITGQSAAAFANRVVPLTTFFGDEADALFGTFARPGTLESRAEILADVIRRRAQAAHDIPVALIQAIDAWLQSAMTPEIAVLQAETGLSLRQLENRTKELYGAPPKLLARKYRALRTANAIANGEGEWQDHANDHFYDHSHCINEIKAFTGIAPSAIREAYRQMAGLSFARRRLEGTIAPLSAHT